MKGKLEQKINDMYEVGKITKFSEKWLLKVVNKIREAFPKPPYELVADPVKWNKWIEKVLEWVEINFGDENE